MSFTVRRFAFQRSSFYYFLCLLALSVLAAPVCAAATLYVSPTGDDNNSGTLAAPYQTIQSAINNAASGDTVILNDGTYSGNGDRDLDFGGKNITLKSRTGAEKTVIDCGGTETDQHNAFRFHGTTGDSAIIGIAIKNSHRGTTGAIDLSAGITVRIADCIFSEDTTGCLSNRGTATLTGCTFANNNAQIGCVTNYGTATLTDCSFAGNASIVTNIGCVTNHGTATLTACSFTNNTGVGGCAISDATAVLNKCSFTGNTTQNSCVISSGTATFTGCTFSTNTSQDPNAGTLFNGGTATVQDCIFTNNTANSGGGIHNASILTATNCTFTGNTAAARGGGVENNQNATLTNCVFTGNMAEQGGGADNYSYHGNSPQISIRYCSFFGNRAVAGQEPLPGEGGGVRRRAMLKGMGTTIVKVLADPSAATDEDSAKGGALENNATATLTNCILWGNTAPYESGIGIATYGNPVTTATYSDIQGGLSGTGNIKADPLFVNPAKGDLHLQPGSPCIGSGGAIPGVVTTRDGKPRGHVLTMGAY